MRVYEFSLLIQASGTGLLFFLFLLLYQKIRLRALSEWIASWGFLFAGLAASWPVFSLGPSRELSFFRYVALLTHALFLLRGVGRLRDARSPKVVSLLWLAPILLVAAWISSDSGSRFSSAVSLVLAASYLTAAVSFVRSTRPSVGHVLLSVSFLLWGVEQFLVGAASIHFRGSAGLPAALHYSGFAAMLLEMMVAVGVILLLFEAGQSRLATEMEQLRHSDRLLKEKSLRDPLTGLYNRGHFDDVLRRELLQARLEGTAVSVLLADVDRFKQINDRMGHAAGDDVLRFVANYLTTCVRESDSVFRWGGDEFLVLLPRTDEAAAAGKARELTRRLPHVPGAERVQPSLSVGWATHRAGEAFSVALAEADARMYEAKLKRQEARDGPEPDLPSPSGGGTPPEPAGP